MKTYKNVSTVEQLGIDPGKTGERDIPKDQEDRMVDRGAIEVVGDAAPAPDPEAQKDEEKAAAEAEAQEKADAEAKEAEEAAKAGQRSGGRR